MLISNFVGHAIQRTTAVVDVARCIVSEQFGTHEKIMNYVYSQMSNTVTVSRDIIDYFHNELRTMELKIQDTLFQISNLELAMNSDNEKYSAFIRIWVNLEKVRILIDFGKIGLFSLNFM